jgi:multidrug resistance efflux pump
VQGGDTIARVSDYERRARLRAVEADVAEREAQLQLLRAGARHEEIALARLAVARAEEPLRLAEAEAERVRTLAARQVATRAELERAEEQVAVLANELEQARGRLAMLRAGNRPEEIAATAQAVARAKAERNRLEGEIARLAVIAPHAGVVMTPRLSQKVGEYVKPGDLIAEVHALDRLTADISVSERDIGEVRLGQPVALRLRAYSNRTFHGTVTRIASAAADTGWREERTVRVEVDLPNVDHVLRPMMTGYARIHLGDRRALDVLTRRVRRYIRVEFWSWW